MVDESGLSYSFSYSGDLTNLSSFDEDKSFTANVEATFGGAYTTYFTSGAYAWNLTFFVSSKAPECDVFFRYFNVTFYTDSNVSKTELPTGTFTWAQPENDTNLSYPQGTMLAQPGMMTACDGNDNGDWTTDRLSLYSKEGSTMTISKNADGTYKFVFALKIQYYDWSEGYYGEVYDWNAEFDNIEVGDVPQTASDPAPDADAEFNSIMNTLFSGHYLGDAWSTGGCAFMIQFPYVNSVYTIQLVINQDDAYTFEKNFSGRFCNTPFADGVYTYSNTKPEAGKKTLVHALYGTKNTPYCYIQNSYTGSKYVISGGSVKFDNGQIIYDLEATIGENTYKFTGSHGATLQYLQDKSSAAANYKVPSDLVEAL